MVVMPVVTVVVVMMTVMTVVVVVMTVAVMTDHVVMTMAAAAVTAAVAATMTAAAHAAAAVTAGVSTGSDERCQADDGRGNESEECSTFKHCQRPSLARCEPSGALVEAAGHWVQAIDFRYVFVHLTFIDGAMVWQDAVSPRIAMVPHRREIG